MGARDERREIEERIYAFMRAFDEKDWPAMEACLAETIAFHSYGRYRFGVAEDGHGAWRITAITQTLTMSDGNPALHSGVVTRA